MPHVQTVSSEPVILTVAQVAEILGLSRAKVYQLVYHEGLPHIRFGTALRVRYHALLQWLEQREQVEQA